VALALERFGNDAATTLSSGVDNVVTTLPVTAGGDPFPTVPQFRVRVDSEIMIVTTAGVSSWTVTRGAEGTAAAAHSSGAAVTHVVTEGALRNYAPRVVLQQRAWMPSTAVAEAGLGRFITMQSQALLTSGTLRLGAPLILPAGQTVSSISICSSTTAAGTPTNQWFCLVRQSDLAVLAKTVNDTTAAWATNALKTLSLAAAYTPNSDEAVYLGVVVTATTVPTLIGWSVNAALIAALSPALSGNSTASLTTPDSLGATAAAVTSSSLTHWGYVS
jgi:hypothetical protein